MDLREKLQPKELQLLPTQNIHLYWASKLRAYQDKGGHKTQVHDKGLWQQRIRPLQSVDVFPFATYRLTPHS